jgi:hypothetical protein
MCCHGGKSLKSPFPQLLKYPEELRKLIFAHKAHMGRCSAYYNNLFTIATTTVDNGGRKKGYENMPNGCVTLNGRTSSFINSKGKMGGVRYFTHNGIDAAATAAIMEQHIAIINGPRPAVGTKALENYIPKVLPSVVTGTKAIEE